MVRGGPDPSRSRAVDGPRWSRPPRRWSEVSFEAVPTTTKVEHGQFRGGLDHRESGADLDFGWSRASRPGPRRCFARSRPSPTNPRRCRGWSPPPRPRSASMPRGGHHHPDPDPRRCRGWSQGKRAPGRDVLGVIRIRSALGPYDVHRVPYRGSIALEESMLILMTLSRQPGGEVEFELTRGPWPASTGLSRPAPSARVRSQRVPARIASGSLAISTSVIWPWRHGQTMTSTANTT